MADVHDPLAPKQEEEADVHFEPVIRLTEQVETKTHEENEDVLFKMRAKLFRFDTTSSEWKERGTGDVRLLQHRETNKIRLVMRRDKTLKVCANHVVTSDMRLQPNIGSDRSWVWKVAADYAESPPTSETLAIRFANSGNAKEFKEQFEDAQIINTGGTPPKNKEVREENLEAEVEKAEEAEEAAEKVEDAEKAKEAASEGKKEE